MLPKQTTPRSQTGSPNIFDLPNASYALDVEVSTLIEALSIDMRADGDKTEKITVYHDAEKKTWYAQSTHSRGLVKLIKQSISGLYDDLPALFAEPQEAPEETEEKRRSQSGIIFSYKTKEPDIRLFLFLYTYDHFMIDNSSREIIFTTTTVTLSSVPLSNACCTSSSAKSANGCFGKNISKRTIIKWIGQTITTNHKDIFFFDMTCCCIRINGHIGSNDCVKTFLLGTIRASSGVSRPASISFCTTV